jgi:spermidine synthase
VLAGRTEWTPPTDSALPAGLRFLTARAVPALFDFPTDMAPVVAQANHLNDQVLVRTYEQEWARINR